MRSKSDGYTQSIQPRAHIIEDNAPALGKLFKPADGKGLGDVEEAEENEGDEGVTPVGGAAEQGDPLAGDLVDDDELRIVTAGFAGDDGGGGDADQQRERDADEQGDQQGLRRLDGRRRHRRPRGGRRPPSPRCRGRACRSPRRRRWRWSMPRGFFLLGWARQFS